MSAIHPLNNGKLQSALDANTQDISNVNSIITTDMYLGTVDTEGTWKIQLSGADLAFYRYESGDYVLKGSFTA